MTGPAIAREDLASLLKWYVDNGIDETIGEEAIDREPEVRPQPRIVVQGRDRAPVPAGHERVDAAGVVAEHRRRAVRGRGQRLGRLLLAPPGEALL